MIRIIFFTFLVQIVCSPVICQVATRLPDGGGDYRNFIDIKEEITPEQRAAIVKELQLSEQRLRSEGKLPVQFSPALTLFAWPLKQAPGYNDNGYYGISNYVDENVAFPNQVKDYNCGSRTYDDSEGYNHAGTDIFSWPFAWKKMATNAVQVIAAAPGTIIAKGDGQPDQNCAFCTSTCYWNAVYVMHADGTVAWYGHLKAGSLTTKAVGATVTEGEYLGVMGSSGNSTGPHLHFELYTSSAYTQLIDPWAGNCNLLNGNTTWWQAQQPYRVSTLNKVMTHAGAPVLAQCANAEVVNEKINFTAGQTIYIASYYRDQQAGQTAVHQVFRPDNTLFYTFNQSLTSVYDASYWYYTFNTGTGVPAGIWRYTITYNGIQKVSSYFTINSGDVSVCGDNNNVLTANLAGSTFQWEVDNGSGYTTLVNNAFYANVNSAQLQLKNLPASYSGFKYRCLVNGTTFSNELTLKFINNWLGNKSTAWEDPQNWSCGAVPDVNTDVAINDGAAFYPVVNATTTVKSTRVGSAASLLVKSGVELILTGK